MGIKKIFILTGETSGDKLASKVIAQLKNIRSDIEYLSVGGEHLKSLGIKSIYDINAITYLGFTKVLLNIFKINNKINKTVEKIIEYNPDILFSVDSPDFTLRVAKKVKKINSKIKTIHYVAPQVWVWREGRVKYLSKFIDHLLLLFNFEKKYFDKENVKSTFVGHPLLDNSKSDKVDLSQIVAKDKKIISLFPGSRISEINLLLPILITFIKKMNQKYNNYFFIFHSTQSKKSFLNDYLNKSNINNYEIISNESIKNDLLSRSIFCIAKSGTVSLEICHLGVPSIIIYKMNAINFFLVKMLIKVKFVNIINIISNSEIIPELIQSKCTPDNIFYYTNLYLNDENLRNNQILNFKKVLNNIKLEESSSKKVGNILNNELIN